MKITIEHEGITATVEDPEAKDAEDAVDMCKGALVAVGFGEGAVLDEMNRKEPVT